MKKQILFLGCLIIGIHAFGEPNEIVITKNCGMAFGQADVAGFRGIPWGESMKSMQAIVGLDAEIISPRLAIYTPVTVSTMDATVLYRFAFDQLVEGIYIIIEDQDFWDRWYLKYMALHGQLVKLYGEPEKTELVIADSPDDPRYYGIHLHNGKLTGSSTWSLQSTIIVLELGLIEDRIMLTIKYSGRGFEPLIEKADAAEASHGL